jgi:hypothetical protein
VQVTGSGSEIGLLENRGREPDRTRRGAHYTVIGRAVEECPSILFTQEPDMRMKLSSLLVSSLLCATVSARADNNWDSIKDAAKQQVHTQAETRLGLANAAPAGAKVYFIGLKDGDTVSSPVKVVFGLSGMGIAPAGTQFENTGHHHLLLDDPQLDVTQPLPQNDQVKHFGKGQTEASIELKPGKHTLQLLFADWKHQPFNPSVQSDKISITVK